MIPALDPQNDPDSHAVTRLLRERRLVGCMSCRPEPYTPNLPRQAGRGAIPSCLFTPHERGEKRARVTAVRCLFALLLCLLAALASGAKAAEPAPVSTDELERLVHSLQNETEREKLIEQLHGLIAARRICALQGGAYSPPGTRKIR